MLRLALLVLLLSGGGCGVRPLADFDLQIAAGQFDEVCFDLRAGQVVHYRFDAVGPLDFNVHWHRGSQVIYAVQLQNATHASERLRAYSKDTYCLMWTNRGSTPVRLRGSVQLVS